MTPGELLDVDQKYILADNHTVQMTIKDAEVLSLVLAHRLVTQAGLPDIVVGLANGANLLTTICGQELRIPAKIVRARRQSSRYKQRLLAIKEALHIPSSWVFNGFFLELWAVVQRRYSKIESQDKVFEFDVRDLHVAVVDDCAISGNSLRYVAEAICARGARKVTTAVFCWMEETYGGTMTDAPDIYLHRKIQWYPWSNKSQYWNDYLSWLKDWQIEHWN